MTFKEEILERGTQRMKHLEDPNYRRLSDVFTISDEQGSNYVSRVDVSMLACYLAGNSYALKEDVKHHIEENINNHEINWRGLFAYLDERHNCQHRIKSAVVKIEFENLHKVLNPYRDRVCPKSTFIGF